MRPSKPTPASIVKGDSYRNFHCPRNQYKIDRKKPVPCVSAVKAWKVFKKELTLMLLKYPGYFGKSPLQI